MTQCRAHLIDGENLFHCTGEEGHGGVHQTDDGRTFSADTPQEKPTIVGDVRWPSDIEVTLRDAVEGPERKSYSFEKWCIEKMWLLIAALRGAWSEREQEYNRANRNEKDLYISQERAARAEAERDDLKAWKNARLAGVVPFRETIEYQELVALRRVHEAAEAYVRHVQERGAPEALGWKWANLADAADPEGQITVNVAWFLNLRHALDRAKDPV